jgi:hypothetical protein
MGRVNMASALTDRGFLGRLVRISLALVMLSACSQQPAEQESDISGARKTSEPVQEQRADAGVNCRDEVVAAFERLKTSGRPYRKETAVTLDRRTYNETVEFVPPDQMRLSDNGLWIMNAYYIRTGRRAWANWSPFPWGWSEEYPNPGFLQMHTAGNEFTVMPNVPPLAYECLGRVDFEGMAYVGYRARLENAIMVMELHNGALSETRERELDRKLDQMPQEWRTVFVAPQSALPAYELVAQENRLGNPSLKVRYTYPQDIDIEPPLWCRLGLCGSVRR